MAGQRITAQIVMAQEQNYENRKQRHRGRLDRIGTTNPLHDYTQPIRDARTHIIRRTHPMTPNDWKNIRLAIDLLIVSGACWIIFRMVSV